MRSKLLYLKDISKNSKSLLNRIRKFPEIISYLNNKYPQLKTLSEKVFWELYEINDFRKCIICGKSLLNDRYNLFSGKFFSEIPYCSQKCAANSVLTKNSRRKTNLEKYGSKTYNNINKIKQTNLEKYGCENVFQEESIKKQIRKQKLEKYGSETFVNPEEAKKTCLERYGCENVFQNESTKEKIKKTNLERYGCEKFVNPEKAKQTNLKRYGCEYPSQNRDIRLKQQARYFYNNIHFDSSPEIALYIYLKDNYIDFEYQPDVKFEYLDEKNKKHRYFPDFRIEDKYYEIKGDQFFNENNELVFVYGKNKGKRNIFKESCMISNNIVILRSKDYQKYLDYITKTYGKDFLKQFKN